MTAYIQHWTKALEFLGLDEKTSDTETDLEHAIIGRRIGKSQMQPVVEFSLPQNVNIHALAL